MAHLTQPRSIFELGILASHFACTKPDVKMNEKKCVKKSDKIANSICLFKKGLLLDNGAFQYLEYLANRTTPETHQLMHYFSMFVPLWHI